MPNEWTSINNAIDSLVGYVITRISDKDEIVHEILNADGWNDAALDLKTKLAGRGGANASLTGNRDDKLPPKKKTIAEKFKESVAERAKRAKW